MKKIKLNIEDMHCASCAMNIDGELEDTNGVISSNTNYAAQYTNVEFNENNLNEKNIIEIIKKTGYTPTISTNN